jgi:hypothetical protein
VTISAGCFGYSPVDRPATLVRDGFATATVQTVHIGKRPLEVLRMRITEAGREAIAG